MIKHNSDILCISMKTNKNKENLSKKEIGENMFNNNLGIGPLSRLPIIRKVKRRRESSWDKTGGNVDWITIRPNEKRIIANINGVGCITHIWFAILCKEKYYLRKVILRIFWDEEINPSVEVPIGDFFGMGHAETKNFSSLPLTMSPENGQGFNCFSRCLIQMVQELKL